MRQLYRPGSPSSRMGASPPGVTEKAAALPVAKLSRFTVRGLIFLLGGHRLWCSEDHVSSVSIKEHKKCPELLLGRLSPPPELCSSAKFRDGKDRQKSRNKQEKRQLFHKIGDILVILSPKRHFSEQNFLILQTYERKTNQISI